MLHIFPLCVTVDGYWHPCQRTAVLAIIGPRVILCALFSAFYLSVGMDAGHPAAKVISNLSLFIFRGMLSLLSSFITRTTSDAGFQVGVMEKKTIITGLRGSCLGPPISSLFHEHQHALAPNTVNCLFGEITATNLEPPLQLGVMDLSS